MKLKAIVISILFLTASVGAVFAGQYSFSGYGTRWGGALFGSVDKSRMCTVRFSVDESSQSSDVAATFQFVNTGNVPIKGDPFFSQKVQLVSNDGKTYEVPWATEMVELKDGSRYEIPGTVNPEKVKDVVTNHPELRKPSPLEKLVAPLEDDSEEGDKNKFARLINPGGTVEKTLYIKDPLIRAVITSKNVKNVIFYSGVGKFILSPQP